MSEITYKSAPLWEHTEPITLQIGEIKQLTLPSSLKSAAKSFYFTQSIVPNEASEYRYKMKASISCKIEYKGEAYEPENFLILFNKDHVLVNGVFENESYLELQGDDIKNITLTIKNPSAAPLTIQNMKIFESDDIKVTSIAKVIKEETLQADLIQATSVFTDATFTQMLETNAMSRSVRIGHPGDLVDYIHIENNEIGFYGAVLGQEVEQFHIQTTSAGVVTDHVYWYAMIEGEDAYKYLTTIDPRVKYPEISESNRDKFKFMVYKPSSLGKKLSIEFAPDEKGNMTPSIIYGAGTDGTGQSNNGKGFTYKNSNGFYHIYQTSKGDTVGIVMDETGVHITGWTDQHCEQIEFRDNGVHIKFTGEEGHNFEYVQDDSGKLTGILQDTSYLTTISYKSGVL